LPDPPAFKGSHSLVFCLLLNNSTLYRVHITNVACALSLPHLQLESLTGKNVCQQQIEGEQL